MSKRLLSLLSLLVIASIALAACAPGAAALECTDAIGCVEIAAGESIHLAYSLATSGAVAFLGEDSLGGIQIAIGERGQVHGHDINLTGEDDLCSAEGGQTAATAIAADPTVVAVIGTNCSSAGVAGLPTLSEAGLTICSTSATSPRLTDPNDAWLPGYFRSAHNDKFQGRLAAEFVYNELGARSAATIHDGSPYADSLQQVFVDVFTALGGTVTFQGAVNVGDTDMRSILTTVAADSPDVLYFPIFEPEGPFIVQQSSEISGLENTVLIGADGLLTAGFATAAGANAEGMYLSGAYASGEAYDAFLATWADQIGGVPPSGYHAHAYDCTNMLLDGITAVAQVGDDGTLLIGRQALRDFMSAIEGFDGLTGSLTCDDYGDCATGQALAIYQISAENINDGVFPPEVVFTP